MSWKKQILIWESTEHSWDEFGIKTVAPEFDHDPLHAKPLVIWKELSLGEVVKRVADAASNGIDYIQDPDAFAGFLLAVSALNLFPLHIKIVEEDEHANKFIRLVHDENGEEFFLASDIEASPELEHLVKYFVEKGLLVHANEKLIIQGKVLNRAFLKN